MGRLIRQLAISLVTGIDSGCVRFFIGGGGGVRFKCGLVMDHAWKFNLLRFLFCQFYFIYLLFPSFFINYELVFLVYFVYMIWYSFLFIGIIINSKYENLCLFIYRKWNPSQIKYRNENLNRTESVWIVFLFWVRLQKFLGTASHYNKLIGQSFVKYSSLNPILSCHVFFKLQREAASLFNALAPLFPLYPKCNKTEELRVANLMLRANLAESHFLYSEGPSVQ